MLKAPSLLDLFANTRKDVQAAKAMQARIAMEGKSTAAGRKGSSDLLPIDAPAKASLQASAHGKDGKVGKGDASTLSSSRESFQSKVKESHARLAAKSQKPAVRQDGNPGLAADKAADLANDRIRSESDRSERADRSGNAERTEGQRTDKANRAGRAERADRAERSETSRQMARDSMKTADGEKAAVLSDDAVPAETSSRPADAKAAVAGCGPVEEASKVSDAELKDSLEALGIYASDEQLQDPRVLADILAMIQTLTMQQNLPLASAPDQAPVETKMPVVATLPALGMTDAEDAVAGETPDTALLAAASGEIPADAPAVPANPADSKTDARPAAETKAAGLVQDKLAELARNPSGAQTDIQRPAATPATTPAGWEGVKVRSQTESVSTSPLPMADLDRLRVMQASALQAVPGAKESEISTVELPGDDGSIGPARESGGLESLGAERDAAGDHGSDGGQDQADLFGRNGDKTGNAGNTASREGSLAAKDGATGPLFHNTLEQARSVDGRAGAGVDRAWEPRQAMQPGVMDQIAKKLSGGGLKNGDEMSIQLSPEHLGKVRVSLEMKDGAMAARILVENDGIRQQVEAGLAVLRDSLENQGIKLQGLEVSVDQRQSSQSSLFNPDGSNSESFFHRNGNGRGGRNAGNAADTGTFESAPESDTGRRLGYNTMEYIG